MSDRTTWYEDCPKCGGKNTMQCYEQLGSNLKLKDCQNDDCDYYVRYDFTEVDGVINITEVPSERLASRKLATSNSKSEDTSLDGIFDTFTVNGEGDCVVDRTSMLEAISSWHKSEVAKLLQVIEDEVILVQCKECEGQHLFKAAPLEALKKIKESL